MVNKARDHHRHVDQEEDHSCTAQRREQRAHWSISRCVSRSSLNSTYDESRAFTQGDPALVLMSVLNRREDVLAMF
jgi:hypothetical protein